MKKKIEVIITNKSVNKYEQWSVNKVTRGYAFNYLIPNNYAEIPTRKRLKHIEMFNEIKNKKSKAQETKIKLFKDKTEQIEKISILKKVGENNVIFGNITEKDVSKWIAINTNLRLHKNKITLTENKSTGKTNVSMEINQNIILKVNVIPVNI